MSNYVEILNRREIPIVDVEKALDCATDWGLESYISTFDVFDPGLIGIDFRPDRMYQNRVPGGPERSIRRERGESRINDPQIISMLRFGSERSGRLVLHEPMDHFGEFRNGLRAADW